MMGITAGFSSGSDSEYNESIILKIRRILGMGTGEEKPVPVPNIKNFSVKGVYFEPGLKMAVLQVHYPDCNNYEGVKILVVEGIRRDDLLSFADGLDPHFMESATIKVVARFEPTPRGWQWAVEFIERVKETTNGKNTTRSKRADD